MSNVIQKIPKKQLSWIGYLLHKNLNPLQKLCVTKSQMIPNFVMKSLLCLHTLV